MKRLTLPGAPKIVLSDNLKAHAFDNGSTPEEYQRIALAALWHAQEPGHTPTQSFDIFNRFRIDDGTNSVRNQYKYLDRIEVGMAVGDPVSFDPLKDILNDVTFVDRDGASWQVSECEPITRVESHVGVMFRDEDGQIWFNGTAHNENVTSLKRISSEMTAGLIADIGPEGLDDLMPFMGEFGISSKEVLTHFTKSTMQSCKNEPVPKHAADLLRLGQSEAEKKKAREKNIEKIISSHLTAESLSFLKDGLTFPIDKDELSGIYRDRSYEDAFQRVSMAYMKQFMDEGWLEKCPNNGPRDVRQITAWNDWIDFENGELDEFGIFKEMQLNRSPAFAVLRTAFIAVSVDIEMDKEKSLAPDGKINLNDRVKFDVTEDEIDLMIRLSIERTVETFREEQMSIGMSHIDYNSALDGARLHPTGSIFSPVLGALGKGYVLEELPVLDAPKIARHLEISIPSGEMVINDNFSGLKGFNEGLEKSIPDREYYSIDDAGGIDTRMQDYFENTGLVIIQVGNTSPSAFQDTPGVWRCGYVDEDDESFWTEDGHRNDKELPEEEWRTSTGVWANVFADRGVLIDIMMASGQFEDRSEADDVFENYLKESEASVATPGVDHLHIYAPTGYGTHISDFTTEFRVEELEYPDWRWDHFILSKEPLTPIGDVVVENDWIEGRIKFDEPEDTPGIC